MRLSGGKTILLLVAAALGAAGFAAHEHRVREQDTLGLIASDIAGRRVAVHCPSFVSGLVDVHGEAGRVQFDAQGRPADHTDLSPETCSELRRLGHTNLSCLDGGTCGYSQFRAGWAAHTLAHESFHLRGFESEAEAECYALQNTAFVAERLGVSPQHATELQQWIFVKGYPNEPDEYQSMACRDGGSLDLHPGTTVFP
jgi:hypothetical protein